MTTETRIKVLNALRVASQDQGARSEVRAECLEALRALASERPPVTEILGRG